MAFDYEALHALRADDLYGTLAEVKYDSLFCTGGRLQSQFAKQFYVPCSHTVGGICDLLQTDGPDVHPILSHLERTVGQFDQLLEFLGRKLRLCGPPPADDVNHSHAAL